MDSDNLLMSITVGI